MILVDNINISLKKQYKNNLFNYGLFKVLRARSATSEASYSRKYSYGLVMVLNKNKIINVGA